MSFLSKLELDGETYNILECKYNFVQPVDGTGKPKGMPKGGDIIIKIESTGNPELLGWMLDHNQVKNGKIILIETKGDHLDAEQKIRLGGLWASKAGNNYRYFMVYERRTVDGAYKLEDFLNIIKDI